MDIARDVRYAGHDAKKKSGAGKGAGEGEGSSSSGGCKRLPDAARLHEAFFQGEELSAVCCVLESKC